MHRTKLTRITASLASGIIAASLLVACGNNDEPDDSAQPTPAEPTTSASPTEATETESPTSTETSTSKSSTTSTSETTRNSTASERDDEAASDEILAQVKETFAPLAPESFFDGFVTCSESGISGSYDCAGPEVGQFQFFDSDSKAASTTQLLTELRSSRVVEDTGRKVVGWSTLGTTAVITVVDNDEGLVMQQMISSDQEDPEERIYELGLSTKAASTTEREADDKAAQVDAA
ncbi:hypothetical protein [Corynebacterium lubricantis]|uniref:hypothetical protein n=1 Tax=Corynebacterium lubricantis TaxID=541095 RepID=UPI000374C021|nr:hypothetical protein [Corynebacterium lubricantis]